MFFLHVVIRLARTSDITNITIVHSNCLYSDSEVIHIDIKKFSDIDEAFSKVDTTCHGLCFWKLKIFTFKYLW